MRVIKDKIKKPVELKTIIQKLQEQGRRVAFTNGCFDILHFGHISYLENAKSITDILVVALNSDSSIKRIKGKSRPILKLKNRMSIIAALESVDFVTYFNQNTPNEIIKLLKPDILVKGGDWNKNSVVGKYVVESYGGRVIILPYIKGESTTKIIKMAANKHHR